MYSDRIVPDDVRQNKLLWGECISGALWWEELYQLAQDAGFSEPRLVRASPVTIGNPEVQKILGETDICVSFDMKGCICHSVWQILLFISKEIFGINCVINCYV